MTLQRHIFETGLGWAGLVGDEARIVAALLPEPDPEPIRRRLLRLHPEAVETEPTPAISAAAERVRGLIEGGNDDLADLPLDYSVVSEFERRVYEIARRIVPGETTTYGEIARQVGEVTDSQAVGKALGRNPFAPIIPCHRVVAAGQKLGGFSATGGRALKLKMLANEARWAKDDLFGRGA
jgi:methylated-DNA-[protein]-cysteine S-methyltransferase